MNVTVPETKKMKKRRIIIYSVIIAICIISIGIAVYTQFDSGIIPGIPKKLGNKTEEEIEKLKENFNQIFNNNIEDYKEEFDTIKLEKENSLVYTKYEKKESKINSYDLEIHIPYININNKTIEKYNKEIEDIFMKISNNILQSQDKNIIYTVEYAANIQNDILSVIIKSNLKESSNAQKIIIQTYNYDLKNNKGISLEDLLQIKKLDKQVIQDKIKNEIAIEQKKAQELNDLGYNIYSRDASSSVYKIENSTEFYLMENTLYIIYAYGNETDTSEMDLVII